MKTVYKIFSEFARNVRPPVERNAELNVSHLKDMIRCVCGFDDVCVCVKRRVHEGGGHRLGRQVTILGG